MCPRPTCGVNMYRRQLRTRRREAKAAAAAEAPGPVEIDPVDIVDQIAALVTRARTAGVVIDIEDIVAKPKAAAENIPCVQLTPG